MQLYDAVAEITCVIDDKSNGVNSGTTIKVKADVCSVYRPGVTDYKTNDGIRLHMVLSWLIIFQRWAQT